MEVTEVANLISHGGVVALALIVWYELREHRKELKEHRKEEIESRKVLADLGGIIARVVQRFDDEDRERRVREAVRDEISGVHGSAGDDVTPVDTPRRLQVQKHTPRGGYTVHRPSTKNEDDK